MLSFFKSNNPTVVIFYIIYLVLFRVCFAFTTTDTNFVFEHREPLSVLLFGFLKNFSAYQTISMVLAAILCFVQALLINGIVNDNKILSKKNYLPGAVFIIFASFFKESLLLTPASVALTFLLICAARLFSLIRKEKAYGDVFDLGFLVALAALFYFPSVLFILFAFIGLAIMRPFNYREWLIVPMGFLSPFLLVVTYYYWNDKEAILLADIANLHPTGWLVRTALEHTDRLMIGAIAVCTVVCLFLLPNSLYSSLIQVRKYANALVVFVVLGFVAAALEQTIHLSHLVLLALPLSVITAMVFMQIKRNWLAEVMHIILILLVLAGQFLYLIL